MLDEQIKVPVVRRGVVKIPDSVYDQLGLMDKAEEHVKLQQELINYAARFLLLVPDTEDRFSEVVNLIVNWSIPSIKAQLKKMGNKNISEAVVRNNNPILEGLSLTDLKPEELQALDGLLAGSQGDLDKIIRGLKQELGTVSPDYESVIKIITRFGKQKAKPEEKATESDVDKLLDKAGSLEDYYDILKTKFHKHVKESLKAFGKQIFFNDNLNLTDRNPFGVTPQNVEEFVEFTTGETISTDDVDDLLSNDQYYRGPQLRSMIDRLQTAVDQRAKEVQQVSESFQFVLDLNEAKKLDSLNESFMVMFRTWVKLILKTIFGDVNLPISVSGSEKDVEAFATAISSEKRYIDSIKKYGLDNKQTYISRSNLASAVKNFERDTGIRWPFK